MNRALLIAFHFPPEQVSSGLQRTLSNVNYLPQHGWEPLVLSANPRVYVRTGEGQLKDIPEGTVVRRAFALDTARHLRVRGRYPGWLALPDRWVSWVLGGVVSGWRMVRQYRPRVLWSTYPIASALLIGLCLHKLTKLPWVVDFRDSMTEPDYPTEPRKRRVFEWIEQRAIQHCSRAVFTTPGALQMYRERYPEKPDNTWALIPNGYDERIFAEVEAQLPSTPSGRPLTLIHSGVIYPQERDPRPLFEAVAQLKKTGQISAESLQIVLRACGHREQFQPMLDDLDIADIVQLEAGIPYREALAEVFNADGLLLLQAANCNHQIPAKLYEYFRAQRPVLALTDAAGDTARTFLDAGLRHLAPLDDAAAIRDALSDFVAAARDGSAPLASADAVEQASRAAGARKLGALFDELIGDQASSVTTVSQQSSNGR